MRYASRLLETEHTESATIEKSLVASGYPAAPPAVNLVASSWTARNSELFVRARTTGFAAAVVVVASLGVSTPDVNLDIHVDGVEHIATSVGSGDQ
jgi:hypothetical protein